MRVITHKSSTQQGYILLSLMLLMTLMMIALTIEAPRVGQQIKREKEEELIHRGNEYRNAIKKYFRKFGRYPLSLDQLENTNNMRFLRKRYKDPFTGKDDWRLLHPGEVQLSVANGAANIPGQPATIGQPIAFGQAGGTPQPNTPAAPNPPPTPGQPGDISAGSAINLTPAPGPGTPSTGATPGSATLTPLTGSSPQLGGGPIIGVASISKLTSIKERNGKNHYNEWPFWYDPRQEQQFGVPGAPVAGAAPGQGVGASPGQGQTPGQGPVFAPGPVNSPSTPPNNPMPHQ